MMKNIEVDTRIRVGDTVQVIAGRDKGKTGKVVRLNKKSGRMVVERVQMVTRHLKRSQSNPDGGIREQESGIDFSSVALFCEKCSRGVRVGVKGSNKDKSLVCKKCGTEIRKVLKTEK